MIIIAKCLPFLACSFPLALRKHWFQKPDDPSGPILFRFVMTDKAKDVANDLALTFDDVDSGWTIQDCRKILQNVAAGMQLSNGTLGISAVSNAANASGTGSTAEPVQASGNPGPPLAIEDAMERDGLLRKTEEALKRSYGLSLNLSRVIGQFAQLPASILTSRHKLILDTVDIVRQQQEPLLRHIVIHGALPGQSKAIGLNDLKHMLKSFQKNSDELKTGLEMARPLLKELEKQETSG